MEEIWKDIKDYEGVYQLSNLGRVKSLPQRLWNGFGYFVTKEKIMRHNTSLAGYDMISIYKDKKVKRVSIHRLVAQYFIENPKNKPEVNHIDGIKRNNIVSNLEWCTSSENRLHALRTGLQKPNEGLKGILNIKSKRTLQYSLDGVFLREFECSQQVQRELGIDQGQISKCANGKNKTAGGFIWKYAI